MGWFTRRRKTSPGEEGAAVEVISGDAAAVAAGPAWTGRALLLPAVPSPATAAEIAGRAVAAAQTLSAVELDFSPASLHDVDAILDGFRGPGSDLMAEPIFVLGCYLGEVMVRNAGYVWVDTPAELAQHLGSLTVYHPGTHTHANPISKAFKRVDYGSPDNLTYFYRAYTTDSPLFD